LPNKSATGRRREGQKDEEKNKEVLGRKNKSQKKKKRARGFGSG